MESFNNQRWQHKLKIKCNNNIMRSARIKQHNSAARQRIF